VCEWQKGRDIVNFQWRQVKGTFDPTATADATLSFAGGDARRVRIPAARMKVFEFTHNAN